MWTTVALIASLSLAPAQAGPLTLTNVRNTYGPLGVVRADNKLLPGDNACIAFEIEGITVDANGKVLYSMTTEIFNDKGKSLFKQDPRDLETINALGGKSLPAYAQIDVGLDQPPGEYNVKVTVTDRATKKSQVLTRAFQVMDKNFGLIRMTTSSDPEGQITASQFQAGHSLFINFGVVSFGRDKDKGNPHVTVELRILDEKGQPTLPKPFLGMVREDAPAKVQYVPMQFLVALNRPGKFTAELKATCQITKKTSTVTFPISVVPSK